MSKEYWNTSLFPTKPPPVGCRPPTRFWKGVKESFAQWFATEKWFFKHEQVLGGWHPRCNSALTDTQIMSNNKVICCACIKIKLEVLKNCNLWSKLNWHQNTLLAKVVNSCLLKSVTLSMPESGRLVVDCLARHCCWLPWSVYCQSLLRLQTIGTY